MGTSLVCFSNLLTFKLAILTDAGTQLGLYERRSGFFFHFQMKTGKSMYPFFIILGINKHWKLLDVFHKNCSFCWMHFNLILLVLSLKVLDKSKKGKIAWDGLAACPGFTHPSAHTHLGFAPAFFAHLSHLENMNIGSVSDDGRLCVFTFSTPFSIIETFQMTDRAMELSAAFIVF